MSGSSPWCLTVLGLTRHTLADRRLRMTIAVSNDLEPSRANLSTDLVDSKGGLREEAGVKESLTRKLVRSRLDMEIMIVRSALSTLTRTNPEDFVEHVGDESRKWTGANFRASSDSSSASEEDSSGTSENEANCNAVAVHRGGAESLNDWQLATLLDHLCSLYVPDHQSSLHDQVYQLLYDQLKKVKIVCPVANLEDVRRIRRQRSVDFAALVKDALGMIGQLELSVTLSADIQERLGTLIHPRHLPKMLRVPSMQDSVALYTSRYSDEFAEKHSLGKGGYGVVFSAKNKLDKCDYAVKKIYVCQTDSSEWIRILQEVELLAQLSHKHIVRYHGVWLEQSNPYTASADPSSEITKAIVGSDSSGGIDFEASAADPQVVVGWQEGETSDPKGPSCSDCGDSCGSSVYLSERTIMENATVILHIQMELCKTTLSDWLQDRNRQTTSGEDVYSLVKENNTRRIMRQVLDGVKYIHDKNIIHRDLKPENIFLMTGDGEDIQVKIGDFGLSRFDTLNMPNAGHQETTTGGGDCYTNDVGTRSYAAPEQLEESSNYSTKADMFSVGLIMFEMYQPFSSGMERQKSFSHVRCQELPEVFTESWPDQARCIEKLVGKADDRPNAEEIIPQDFLRSNEEIDADNHKQVSSSMIKLQKERILRQEEKILQQEQKILQQEETILQQKETILQQQQIISQQNKAISQQNKKCS
ncbi:Eukaryotic translation initiation factor 2-alpha kinase 1 [Lamellibrachia satsuma]|nr:Eukaryotic translation initiation factor 2-alpha kinase 1 [Lamellibrachia satsuma]